MRLKLPPVLERMTSSSASLGASVKIADFGVTDDSDDRRRTDVAPRSRRKKRQGPGMAKMMAAKTRNVFCWPTLWRR
jgi:hypothetical protein